MTMALQHNKKASLRILSGWPSFAFRAQAPLYSLLIVGARL